MASTTQLCGHGSAGELTAVWEGLEDGTGMLLFEAGSLGKSRTHHFNSTGWISPFPQFCLSPPSRVKALGTCPHAQFLHGFQGSKLKFLCLDSTLPHWAISQAPYFSSDKCLLAPPFCLLSQTPDCLCYRLFISKSKEKLGWKICDQKLIHHCHAGVSRK